MAAIIDGNAIAAKVREELKLSVERLQAELGETYNLS